MLETTSTPALLMLSWLFLVLAVLFYTAKGKKALQLSLENLDTLTGRIILVGAGLPCIFLFFYSLIFTTVYESNDLELPSQAVDPAPLLLLFVAAGVLSLHFVGKAVLKKQENRERNMKLLFGAVLLHCAVFCTVWNLTAKGALRSDPLFLHAIAGSFATGDFSPGAMDYLYTYPHQAGQALLLELVYRVFGYENLFAFRMLNTLGVLVFVASGYKITELLYGKDETKVNYLLLSAGCVPLFIYTNVIYGEVLAAAATSFAILMLLLWLREERFWQLALMLLSLVFAVYMKNNALIAAVAIGIVILCKAVSQRKRRIGAVLLPLAVILLVAQMVMTGLYEYRSGMDLNQGMPKNLWVAMGFQGEGMTSGWWNEFPDHTYKEQANYEPQTAKALGNAAISVSLRGFRENPKAAAVFFLRKFVSQWNDSSYGCQVSSGSQDTPWLEFWMNGYHSLVFLGAAVFALTGIRKRRRTEECLPLLILQGGFLFHIIWEVKGRYGIYYFALLLPAAASGLEKAGSILRKLFDKGLQI